MMRENDFILKGAEQLGLTLTNRQLEQLLDFKRITLEVNQSMNLTSILEDQDFIIKHYFDSFTLCKFMNIDGSSRVLDMGTGAGIPGIPLKILYPEVEFVLVDSLNKRVEFLKDVVEHLKLDRIQCIHGRAEELGQDTRYRESFDIVVSRAVARISILSEYCLPFVKQNGSFLCLKGPRYKEELEEGRSAILKLGGKLEDVVSVRLPYSDIDHFILKMKKSKQTPTKFPRKPGKPTKSPIK